MLPVKATAAIVSTWLGGMLVGCAGGDNIRASEQPLRFDSSKAYLYGDVLVLETDGYGGRLDPERGHLDSAGISLKCSDNRTYLMVARNTLRPLDPVVEIVPATCSAEAWFIKPKKGRTLRQAAKADWYRDVPFEAGKAYYIGALIFRSDPNNGVRFEWTGAFYDESTSRLRHLNPDLTSAPTENRSVEVVAASRKADANKGKESQDIKDIVKEVEQDPDLRKQLQEDLDLDFDPDLIDKLIKEGQQRESPSR